MEDYLDEAGTVSKIDEPVAEYRSTRPFGAIDASVISKKSASNNISGWMDANFENLLTEAEEYFGDKELMTPEEYFGKVRHIVNAYYDAV